MTREKLHALSSALPSFARFALGAPTLHPKALNGPDIMLRHAAWRYADRDALRFEARRWTWSAFNQDVERWAAALQALGLKAGDQFALLMDNRPAFLMLYHAANRLGVVPALLNTSLSGPALAHVLQAVELDLVIVGSEHAAKLQDDEVEASAAGALPVWVVADDDAPADCTLPPRFHWLTPAPLGARVPLRPQRMGDLSCYIYTSGTTGFPKAALIRNQRVAAAGALFGRIMHRVRAGEVIYIPLPLYHTNALGLAWGACLATGATAALRRRFSVSRFWDDVEHYGVTSFIYIGELCRYLVQAPPHPKERGHGLRSAVGNGARADVSKAFSARFGVPAVREFYGSTEGNAFTLNISGRPGMIGKMRRGQAVLRCDLTTGELERDAKGRAILCKVGETGLFAGKMNDLVAFDGYADPEANQKKVLRNVLRDGDQWFDTSDLVQLHEGKWLSFVDRLGDTYRWKGENVSTAEVESLLARAPSVQECAVLGVPVPHAEGRAGLAVLRVDEGFELSTFCAFLEASVPRFQQPRFFRFVDEAMETTGTYKIKKSLYAELGFAPAAGRSDAYLYARGMAEPIDDALYTALMHGQRVPD